MFVSGGGAGCTGQAFSTLQLTTLGNKGPNGPTSVDGYATLPAAACPDSATQLVLSGGLAISSDILGVQRFTVPVTGTYRLDVNGKDTYLAFLHIVILSAMQIFFSRKQLVADKHAQSLPDLPKDWEFMTPYFE